MDGLMKAKVADLKQQEKAQTNAVPPPKPDLATKPVLPNGKFSLAFTNKMTGLSFLNEIGV